MNSKPMRSRRLNRNLSSNFCVQEERGVETGPSSGPGPGWGRGPPVRPGRLGAARTHVDELLHVALAQVAADLGGQQHAGTGA